MAPLCCCCACKINEKTFITIDIHVFDTFLLCLVLYLSPILSTRHWEIENHKANNTYFIVSSAVKRRGD